MATDLSAYRAPSRDGGEPCSRSTRMPALHPLPARKLPDRLNQAALSPDAMGSAPRPSANGANVALLTVRITPLALITSHGGRRRRSELWSAPCDKARTFRSTT